MEALVQKDAYGVLPAQPLGEYLQSIVDVLKQHEARLAAAETLQTDERLARVEAQVRELQGVDLGEGYSGDTRLRAIEDDLRRRAPTDKISDPCTVVLAANLYVYRNHGGPVVLRQTIAEKLGLDKADVVVLGDPIETEHGIEITFRLQFPAARRESAEGVADNFCKRLHTTPSVLMGQKVVAAYRPEPRVDMHRRANSRVGAHRHTLAGSVTALVAALANAHKRLSDSEFWLYNARRYFGYLKAYRRHRWKDRLPLLQQFLSDNRKVLLAVYWRKLTRFVPHSKTKKRYHRVMKQMMLTTDTCTRRFFHNQALRWLEQRQMERKQANKRKTLQDSLLRATQKGLRRYVFKTWEAWARKKATKRAVVDALTGTNKRLLYWKYNAKLRAFAELMKKQRARRRLQHKLSHELVVKSAKRCALEAFNRLRLYTQRRQRMRDKHNMALIHDFLQNNNTTSQQIATELSDRVEDVASRLSSVDTRVEDVERQVNDMGTQVGELNSQVGGLSNQVDGEIDKVAGEVTNLNGTVDKLGNQVDVSLKTLTNTNSVLNKLVDRLISVDEQLDHLDKNKAGRGELDELRRRQNQQQPQYPVQQQPTRAAPKQDPHELAPARNISPQRTGVRGHGRPSGGGHHDTAPPRTSTTPTRAPHGAHSGAEGHPPPHVSGMSVSPSQRDAQAKEAEQLRLLTMERARLQEVAGGGGGSAPPSSHPNQPQSSGPRWAATPPNPTPEETLLRARQWQQSQSRTTSPAKLAPYASGAPAGAGASRPDRDRDRQQPHPYLSNNNSAWRLS